MAVSTRSLAQDELGRVIPLEAVLERFEGVRRRGSKYIALCPAHADREPSLEITMNADDTRILIHDFGGCDHTAVREAAGLTASDLRADSGGQRAENDRYLDRLWAKAQTQPWPGKSGASQWKLLEAHVENARIAGTHSGYGLSERAAAEAAGLGRKAVRSANYVLEWLGWLLPYYLGTAGKATRWELRIPEKCKLPPVKNAREELRASNALETGAHLHHPDLWRWSGLNPNSYRIARALSARPMTASELANALGLVPSTIRRRLKIMASAGMVARRDQCWTLLAFNPADIVAGTPADGASARQTEAHRRERQGYRIDYIARFGKDPYGADLKTGEVAQEVGTTVPRPASVAS